MATVDRLDRKRLAAYVKQRRVELGMRDRRKLERISGISDRTIGKVELGQKVNDSTLASIELALDWEPGSVVAILEGNEPLVKGQSRQEPTPRRVYTDPVEQRLWESIADIRITGDPEEDERIKKGMIRYARAAQEDGERRAS